MSKNQSGNATEYYWLLFKNDTLLIQENGGLPRFSLSDVHDHFEMDPASILQVGSLQETDCCTADLSGSTVPAGYLLQKPRDLYGQVNETVFQLILRAFHLRNWKSKNKFCGCCGDAMRLKADETALKCTTCGNIAYPRISPAIIVAVRKGDRILLGRSNRFPPGRYSVLAGFVEPGETLEACVRREVQEEVGIQIQNIRYFGSQPWPFPDSLMVAFTAEYASGEIAIDHNEIVDAGWYSASALPDCPPKDSIARQLIDWFVDQYSWKTRQKQMP